MRTFTLLLPLMLAAGLQQATPVEPGFTSLFNGKDFTGWKISGPAESFTIHDSAIVERPINLGDDPGICDLDKAARVARVVADQAVAELKNVH